MKKMIFEMEVSDEVFENYEADGYRFVSKGDSFLGSDGSIVAWDLPYDSCYMYRALRKKERWIPVTTENWMEHWNKEARFRDLESQEWAFGVLCGRFDDNKYLWVDCGGDGWSHAEVKA